MTFGASELTSGGSRCYEKTLHDKAIVLFNFCVGAFFEFLTAKMNTPTRLIVKTVLNVLWQLLSPKAKATAVFTVITMYIIALSLICR